MRFQIFYEDEEKSYLDRYVWHLTPVTKKRTRVKVKSLPPEEQEKYRPDKIQPVEPAKTLPDTNLIDFFLIVDDPDYIKDLQPEQLTKATDDSAEAIKFSDKGKYIIKVIGVPVQAVKSYQNDDGEWYDFEDDMTDDNIYEFIKFEEHKMFLLDLYKWKNILHFKDGGDADVKKEGVEYIERLLIENEVGPLDQKFITKLVNHIEKMFPTYAELDSGINIELRNVIRVGDGKEVKKVKQKIHDILQRAKTKLLRDIQNKVEKIKATRKDKGNSLVQPQTSDKTIPDKTVPEEGEPTE